MRKLSLLFTLIMLLSTSMVTWAQSENPSFRQGLAQFQAQDYRSALESFERASLESPSNTPIQLWLGIACVAVDDGWRADDVWRAGIGDAKWEAAVWALKGLGFWKRNNKNNAIYYFKQAQPSQRGYEINRKLLARISADGDMPPLSEWGTIVGLQASPAPAVTSSASPGKAETLAPNEGAQAPAKGVRPEQGAWRGKITNQGGDQIIEFRVSSDGSLLTDITFVGYWRCPDAMNPTQSTRNAPPDDVAVIGGAFSSTQNDKPSRLWYEFIGRFDSPGAAQGSLRMAYAGGECDTYKLTWTASKVGP